MNCCYCKSERTKLFPDVIIVFIRNTRNLIKNSPTSGQYTDENISLHIYQKLPAGKSESKLCHSDNKSTLHTV